MLVRLHVQNFAIIEELEIEFSEGLNILSGETGSGKSILIGSINAALGGKVSKEMIRSGAEYALVELLFYDNTEQVNEKLHALELPCEDGDILLTRRVYTTGRSVYKINGEMATAAVVRELASLLIDIHGQHEHQSLLHKQKHMDILDRFLREKGELCKREVAAAYARYTAARHELEEAQLDEDVRLREISYLEYEVNEIRAARLLVGEDETLEQDYKRLSNAQTIAEGLAAIYRFTEEADESASYNINRAVKQILRIEEYDEALQGFSAQLADIEGLLDDFNRELADYTSRLEAQGEALEETGARLDIINRLKAKYGNSIEKILARCEKSEEKLQQYADYDTYLAGLQKKLKKEEDQLVVWSEQLTELRKDHAGKLAQYIREALVELNFLEVRFEIAVTPTGTYSANGSDDVEFLICTNPGEPLQPLQKVASGGELSRVMLAIKSVLADRDEIQALIFDEIDAGISGRTAQKVAERLALIAGNRQVLCITHLPQLAAMADCHFLIEKAAEGAVTKTQIRRLSEEESGREVARIIGGAVMTEGVYENAHEMRRLASLVKQKVRGA